MKIKDFKICPICNRPFENHKKWENRGQWSNVVYCSDKCRSISKEKEMKDLWIKRDLRISDNESLHRGSLECDELLPFFCWETEVIQALDYSAFHLQAQWQALNGLRKSLRVRKSDVWEDSNDIIKALIAIRRSYQFEVIYSHQKPGI